MYAGTVLIRLDRGHGCAIVEKWESARYQCSMTEGRLTAASDLHCLPTADIGDVSIGRIIDQLISQCCIQ